MVEGEGFEIMTKNNDIKQFWLGGKHTVNHALKNENNTISKVFLSKNYINEIPKKYLNLISIKSHQEIDKLFSTKINHQGYALKIKERKIFQFSELKKTS